MARVRGGVGTIRCPGPGRGAGKGAVPPAGRAAGRAPASPRAALRAWVQMPGDCAQRLRSRGEAPPARGLAPEGRGPRPPPSSRGKVQCGARGCGLRVPAAARGSAAEPRALGLGGHRRRALPGKSPPRGGRGTRRGFSAGWEDQVARPGRHSRTALGCWEGCPGELEGRPGAPPSPPGWREAEVNTFARRTGRLR